MVEVILLPDYGKMATSRDLSSCVTDIVTCPICSALSDIPKSLPCLHTFCLKCIEGHCRDNEPGDEAACPVCRQKFNIPESGVKGLESNFFIAGLVDSRKTASDVTVQVPCEVCLLECDDNSKAAVSTMYCVDCNQKLCELCCRPHRRMKGGPHKVLPIGSAMETELIQTQGGRCNDHPDEVIKWYCFDCQLNICLMCNAVEHRQHRGDDINTVASEYTKQIDTDLEMLNKRAEAARIGISRLGGERCECLSSDDAVVNKVVRRGEELKQLIDAQVNELTAEVQSLKTEKCKEIESFKDNLEMELRAFETFSAYCSVLKLKGKPCEVTRAANNLHKRATELLQNDVTLDDYCPKNITFVLMDTHELLDAGQNFIGNIKLCDSTQPSSISFVTCGMRTLEQQLAQSADTERSLRQQIEECHSEMADNDKMWTEKVNDLQTQITQLKQQETEIKTEEVKSEKINSKLLAQCEQLRNGERDLKEKLEKSENELKRLDELLEKQKVNENSLKEELKRNSDREQLLREHLEKVPRVVDTLPEVEMVLGVTSLNDELYVLRDKDKEQVEVFNTTTTTTTTHEEYRLVRRLSVPGVTLKSLCDMTSCKHYRCLYIADRSSFCVHRVAMYGKATKISFSDKPYRLSVTSQFTVLVTCFERNILLELTTEGKQLREINLQSDIIHPWHAIQLSNGQFVVCHGYGDDTVHRVCIVDTNGHVTQSYGGPRSSATVEQLNVPYHLAVDKDEFIFVADIENSRVLLLSPTLSFVREIVSRDMLNGDKPWRLFLDVDRRRLYVAVGRGVVGGVVVVFQL